MLHPRCGEGHSIGRKLLHAARRRRGDSAAGLHAVPHRGRGQRPSRGGKNPLLPTSDGYAMDLEGLRRIIAADKGIKMLLLCNPHNPIGIQWSRDTLLPSSPRYAVRPAL